MVMIRLSITTTGYSKTDFRGCAGAGAFWSGIPDSSGLLPEPKHFWYDIHEYRLNSKPHIRRILQHQQAQADGITQASAEESVAAQATSQAPRSTSEPHIPQHQEVHKGGSTQSAAPSAAAGWMSRVPETSTSMAAPPQPEQRHESAARSPAAPGTALSKEPMSSDGWQPPGSPKQEKRAESEADVKGTGAKRHQGAHGKRLAPDSWQPVTASQMLKRQRIADTAPQLLQEPQKSAETCQQVQPEQPSLFPDSMREGTNGPDILLQPSEQEACDDSGSCLEYDAETGQHVDSEESCEDVLAMWGEAGEPEQEFAWAEPPAGMGNGDTDGNSATIDHASTVSHRTWACQVCKRTFSSLCVAVSEGHCLSGELPQHLHVLLGSKLEVQSFSKYCNGQSPVRLVSIYSAMSFDGAL